eukprot:scaffold4163_cov129-Skeletonema_marinoi.AAC.1
MERHRRTVRPKKTTALRRTQTVCMIDDVFVCKMCIVASLCFGVLNSKHVTLNYLEMKRDDDVIG